MYTSGALEPRKVLRRLRRIVGERVERGTPLYDAFYAGREYTRMSEEDRKEVDATLQGAGLDIISRAVLIEGSSFVEVGKRVGSYKTEQQARAFAVGQMLAALRLMAWHLNVRGPEMESVQLAMEIKRKRDEKIKRDKEIAILSPAPRFI